VTSVVGCLVGLAVWFGGRVVREWRRVRTSRRIGVPQADERTQRARPVDQGWVWFVVAAFAGFLAGHVIGAVLGAAAVLPVRRQVLRRRQRGAHAERDEQLADAVGSISAAIRAGMSVPQALDYAARETPPPLGGSLAELVDELALGVPLATALDRWAAPIRTDDARLLVSVLGLHRRSGGDLPSVLDQVATALRERRSAAREVRALTAQARLSGGILGFLPIGFFGFLWLTSRQDVQGAFHNPAGVAAMAIGLTLEGLAFVWIRRLLAVR
jgi:tight adherence protein B